MGFKLREKKWLTKLLEHSHTKKSAATKSQLVFPNLAAIKL